ncbi:MAG TPA: hypothetical protein PLB46_06435 [Chitinophagales bacterium]|nr:hypothetical protein [Chitinophagales bacterium]HRG84851.1 hypothetical protein [Chitinophagales bacterium]HRH53263.1 hypothetical protein [Chitinophagales bacterium]
MKIKYWRLIIWNRGLVILLLSSFVWSCKPDEQIIIDDDPCFFPDIDFGINGPIADYAAIQYLKPCFNPSNENEIVYIEEQPTSGISRLCVLNIVDLTISYIQDNVSGSPKWSKTDWIIFNKDEDIWKIKPDGDSLTLLFSNGTNYSPEVNPRGDKIIFKYQLDNYIAIKISDLNGNVIDSLEDQALYCPSWSPDGTKISMRRAGEPSSFGYYDTTLTTFSPIITNTSGSPFDMISDTRWFPDSEHIFWFGSGFYSITNITTMETEMFRDYCPKNSLLYPNFSSALDIIIWEKNTIKLLENNSGYIISTSIVMTDLDGANEVVLLE